LSRASDEYFHDNSQIIDETGIYEKNFERTKIESKQKLKLEKIFKLFKQSL
jgi:hypothetical protein